MENLPTLADLHHDVQSAFQHDKLNLLLNQPPHQSWVKKHPMTKTDYLPIDKVEFMLTRIFGEWRLEIKEIKPAFNSMLALVRLHYRHPISGEWTFHDGTGAMPIQTDAGKSAADLGAIKNAAVQMSAPGAVSYALKDAAEHLGALFGRDLNRKDTVMFAGAYGVPEPAPEENGSAKKQTFNTAAL